MIDMTTPGIVRFSRDDVRNSTVLAQATSVRYRIDGALRAGPLTTGEIYDALDAAEEGDRTTVRSNLKRWSEKGHYVRLDQGGITRYGLAQ